MKRIALGLEYIGANYHGWQMQDNLTTIEREVELALSKVANSEIKVFCAGRTDVGVNAFGQVVHFDTRAERNNKSWIFGANTYLPKDIRVQWAKEVPADFDARFSATARTYRYFIYNSFLKSAIFNDRITSHYQQLDEKKMQAAAMHLLGEHDFSSFRGSGCQSKSPNRFVEFIKIKREGSAVIIDVKANAFLLHMVRNIVGVLLEIGEGRKEPFWAKEVLMARDRTFGAITAPPDGLYLMSVEYPEKYFLPKPIEYGLAIS
jgi:tRNA pseudouridine38-40 synthase